ncbi:Ankyrin repeats (3 copies) [Aquisphaera giovannonii]|uniref:Ankyrin repeats (3 copies) n=1 Tax=Aquisphaera giovannonii TaxID=406548 RepID=A0A5B9WEF0_9BACT|nr:ankyrin repeat domain-containing protein [Aquisphaera giovannonii]QEH38584.1 Ankyrin repeats (3 copies) [Aquisphaera giovannonii]
MAARWLPVRPDLDQLRNRAKDLLRRVRGGAPAALAELNEHHPRRLESTTAKLADAQLALARGYGVPSWPRLVLACRVVDAIWRDDVEALRLLILRHPRALHEMARGTERCNWGPPMSYAANLGRDRIIRMLRGLGAKDLDPALDRAILQGRIGTARQLLEMGARIPRGAAMGPAETLNADGLAFLLERDAEICDEAGDRLAPVALLLQTYGRNPAGKHRCLELLAAHGVALPDTPPMAIHRGRIDLLEAHVRRDPALLGRTFTHGEIYPPGLGCHGDESLASHGTPLGGATLLHMCIDYDEIEVARWLLGRGMDADARAAVDAEGFGGHTALFGAVVSAAHLPQKHRRLEDAPFARLLLEHGADPNARASLRKRLRGGEDESMHEYRDVTPVSWGERFHDRGWVSEPAIRLIRLAGGHG